MKRPAKNPAAAAAVPPQRPDRDSLEGQASRSFPWFGLDPSSCAGVDEVGRGSLFGPVFAAAVILPAEAIGPLAKAGLTDSKRLTPRRRAALLPLIERIAGAWALGQATAAEIDRHGIRDATERAMVRALKRLPAAPRLLIVDGNLALRPWSGSQVSLVRGDSLCPAVAAASVLAKERRDALMRRLAQRYPGYGLDVHAGYGTQRHRQAILTLGFTPLHRVSFLSSLRTSAGSLRPAGVPPLP